MTLETKDIEGVPDNVLRRLLDFALDRDVSGPRLRQQPPRDRREVIIQLMWLGVVRS
jgi:hypothetical protein